MLFTIGTMGLPGITGMPSNNSEAWVEMSALAFRRLKGELPSVKDEPEFYGFRVERFFVSLFWVRDFANCR